MTTLNTNGTTALSGDVGGTKTRLQITRFTANQKPEILVTKLYRNSEFTRFRDIVTTFLDSQTHNIDCACIAVAGPVNNGEVKLTNLPWHFTETQMKNFLNIDRVKFINDFEAIGYGAPILEQEDYFSLQSGQPRTNALQAIIGAGTGLGVALIAKHGEHHTVYATEGGHTDFAPADNTQENLLLYLRKKFHRVSSERVVSGIGIENIYHYLIGTPEYAGLENDELKHASHFSKNFGAEIARFALEHDDPIALHTIDTFIRCYGTVAGNLALTTLPYGGLYIAGGIAPKLLQQMRDGRFMSTFLDKGRMSNLLYDIPIKIILNTKVGLIGAAYCAAYLI
jgi:glucokinase